MQKKTENQKEHSALQIFKEEITSLACPGE